MPRGARKGERRGGRKVGVPNKANSGRIERADDDRAYAHVGGEGMAQPGPFAV
jgi:hypothetical protein